MFSVTQSEVVNMKKGTTLIEVLVTALILVISLTGILFSFVTAKNLVRESVHRANAAEIINEQFEGIQRRTTADELDQFFGNNVVVDENSSDTFYPKSVLRNINQNGGTILDWDYYVEFQVSPIPDSGIAQVIARVSWDPNYTSGDSPHSLYMVMYTNIPG